MVYVFDAMKEKAEKINKCRLFSSAHLGTYTYYGQVGPYPVVWDSDSFTFTATSTLAPQGETRKGWELLENGLTK